MRFWKTTKPAMTFEQSKPREVVCEKCKCLLYESDAKKVNSNPFPNQVIPYYGYSIVLYYCHSCKPPYDRTAHEKYYKIIPERIVECTKDGEEILTVKG